MRLLLVAGEVSGDQHAAALLAALKERVATGHTSGGGQMPNGLSHGGPGDEGNGS